MSIAVLLVNSAKKFARENNMNDLAKKVNSAVWIILISNILGGVAFIIAFFITKEIILLIGGFFIMIAAVAFKLLIQKFIDKINNIKGI